MQDYQREFIELAIAHEALRFGEFTLKSGRTSPYFFNAGQFNTGRAIETLGRCYANAIVDSGIQFDMLFGPAYKGIPLATATAIALATEHGVDVPYAFNRKEAKAHGEGGTVVGAPLEGRILIVDDVITAGTAIREAVDIIDAENAFPVAVVIALDRQEKGMGGASAIEEIQQEFGFDVASIITLGHLIAYLQTKDDNDELLDAMNFYRAEYGA